MSIVVVHASENALCEINSIGRLLGADRLVPDATMGSYGANLTCFVGSHEVCFGTGLAQLLNFKVDHGNWKTWQFLAQPNATSK